MAVKTIPFDPAVFLDDDDAIRFYVDDALETGDPAQIEHAEAVALRARGLLG